MTSIGVAWSVLATSPDLLDPPTGKVKPDSGILIAVVGMAAVVGALDDRVDP